MYEGFSRRLDSLYGGLKIKWIAFFYVKKYIFFSCNLFSNFQSLKSWIRIDQKCWIQIRIDTMRIHNSGFHGCWNCFQTHSQSAKSSQNCSFVTFLSSMYSERKSFFFMCDRQRFYMGGGGWSRFQQQQKRGCLLHFFFVLTYATMILANTMEHSWRNASTPTTFYSLSNLLSFFHCIVFCARYFMRPSGNIIMLLFLVVSSLLILKKCDL